MDPAFAQQPPEGAQAVLARQFGIPMKVRPAVETLASGKVRRIDIGRSNDRYFTLMAGFGFDAEVVAGVLNRDRTAFTVTEPLGLDPARVRVPDGRANDIEEACERYELAIRDAGGVDIQILGIGANGHIGFNEPSSSLSSRTRIKTLTPKTRADNARFFDSLDRVPVHCLTQGLGTILDADEVVLVAQGASKADAVAAMVEGPVSASCPGSILQTHQYATIVVDEAAASKLANHEYYRWAYAHKPAWQGFGQD